MLPCVKARNTASRWLPATPNSTSSLMPVKSEMKTTPGMACCFHQRRRGRGSHARRTPSRSAKLIMTAFVPAASAGLVGRPAVLEKGAFAERQRRVVGAVRVLVGPDVLDRRRDLAGGLKAAHHRRDHAAHEERALDPAALLAAALAEAIGMIGNRAECHRHAGDAHMVGGDSAPPLRRASGSRNAGPRSPRDPPP